MHSSVAAEPHPQSQTSPAPTVHARQSALFVWTVWTVMDVACVSFVMYWGSNVPFLDDWEIVPTLTGNRPFTWDWLWAQHNEHRIPLPRLLLLALYHVTGGDFRAGMFFNVAALAIITFTLIRTARRVRGWTSAGDAIFPLLLLHCGHAGNLLWSWQVGFVLSTCLSLIILQIIVRTGARLSAAQGIVVSVCLLLLPLCGAAGLAMTPALALWLAVCGFSTWYSSPRLWRSPAIMMGGAAAALALVGLYFLGMQKAAISVSASPPANPAMIALELLSLSFGWIIKDHWWLWSVLAVGFLVCAGVSLYRLWRHQPVHRQRTLGLFFFLVAELSLVMGVAWGRSAVSPTIGLSIRYITLLAPLPCAIYFVLMLDRWPPAHWTQVSLILIAALMLFPNTRQGLGYAAQLYQQKAHFERDLRAGVPRSILAEQYSRYPDGIYSSAKHLDHMLGMLNQAGIGMFRDLRADPPYRVVELREDLIQRPDDHRFILNQPRFVYALRLKYAFQPVAPSALFTVRWSPADGHSNAPEHQGQFRVVQEPDEHILTIWINETIDRFAIYPDQHPYHCRVSDMQLLVPRSGQP